MGPLLHFLALYDLPELQTISIFFKSQDFFFQFLSHAGTVEENT